MPAPFFELDVALRRKDISRKYAAEKIGKGESSLSDRITGKTAFSLPEVYTLLELIDEPPEKMAFYFPNVEIRERARKGGYKAL